MKPSQSQNVLVSICCVTYNQEAYIEKAIEGFLMQKTSFKYEIIIGEDSSTDGTLKIVSDYQKKYPELIKVITSPNNVGMIKNGNRVRDNARGKYLAICDGDDFWTDPLKLQKQVDFMENNSDYIICCHYSKVIDENDNEIFQETNLIPLEYSYEDILVKRKRETRTSTLLIRNTPQFKKLSTMEWFHKCSAYDTIFKLYATVHNNEKIYVIPEVMSCYRVHDGGVWSKIDSNVRKGKMKYDFNTIIHNFKYSASQKKQILKVYLTEYLIYDLKNFNLRSIYSTLKTLS